MSCTTVPESPSSLESPECGRSAAEATSQALKRSSAWIQNIFPTIEEKYKTKKYYKEEINGVKVLRIRVPEFSKTNKKSRVKNIVSYFFGAMGATFKVGKMDYVFSMKMMKVEYGKNLLLKGVPIIFNKGGAKLKIGENVTIKSSFLSIHG